MLIVYKNITQGSVTNQRMLLLIKVVRIPVHYATNLLISTKLRLVLKEFQKGSRIVPLSRLPMMIKKQETVKVLRY